MASPLLPSDLTVNWFKIKFRAISLPFFFHPTPQKIKHVNKYLVYQFKYQQNQDFVLPHLLLNTSDQIYPYILATTRKTCWARKNTRRLLQFTTKSNSYYPFFDHLQNLNIKPYLREIKTDYHVD